MTRLALLLCLILASSAEGNRTRDGTTPEKNPGTIERTWKMDKKGVFYLIAGLILKALLLIKLALGKLTVLGNISIILSKLSLILSLLAVFGKYFKGLSKMLRPGTDQHVAYYHSDGGNHFSYPS